MSLKSLYIIYIYKDNIWVHQRSEGDIWQGLWEFVLNEQAGRTEDATFSIKHQLTHQTLYADFVVKRIENDKEAARLDTELQPMGYRRVTWMEWQGLAVPRLIDEANRRISEAWL